MKLITEYLDDTRTIIEEGVDGSPKKLFIEGIFMQADIKNRNGRVYPMGILENETNKYIERFVVKGNAMGELNHPQRPNVDPERASHVITELRREGSNYYGKAKIITRNPVGKIVEGLILEGITLGVSSRGIGSLKVNSSGINEVQNDFRLSTIDIVSDPSGPDCFVNGIMEGKDWVWNSGAVEEEVLEKVQAVIAQTKRIDEAKLLQVFNRLMILASNPNSDK